MELIKVFVIVAYTLFALCLSVQSRTFEESLWPRPNMVTKGNDKIVLDKESTISFTTLNPHPVIEKILSIYEKIINVKHRQNILQFLTIPQEPSSEVEVNITIHNPMMKKFSSDYLPEVEEYSLKLTQESKQPKIYIDANYFNGLIYALETLSQIFNHPLDQERYETISIPLEIKDRPEYGFRGVMIDTSRHFVSIAKIKEIIDGMMYNKMNVLHWHLTDDEYYGLEVKNPKDPQKYFYSDQDLTSLAEYAFIRGITIIPEVDNPSHSMAWSIINPDIVIRKPEYGTLNPTKDITYTTVEQVVRQVRDIFSPYEGDYIHLGGDEVQLSMWSTPEIKQFMKDHGLKTVGELENYYFTRIRQGISKMNKYIYWMTDEDKDYDVYLNENTLLMYWGMDKNLRARLDGLKGQSLMRNIILCNADYLYLDCGSGNKYGDGTWCGGYITWKHIYKFPVFKQYKNFTILGSQVVMFGELSDENSIIGKIFPRALSLAEVLWTKPESRRDMKSAFIRILNQNKRIIERGVKSISITTQLCENDPEQCIGNF